MTQPAQTPVAAVDGEKITIAFPDSDLAKTMTREQWLACADLAEKQKQEIRDLQRRLNASDPSNFVALLIGDLRDKYREAHELRTEGAAGKIMFGQAQAYADCIAMVDGYADAGGGL